MGYTGGYDEAARIEDFGIIKESEAAVGTFALNLHIFRADNFRTALIGRLGAVDHDNVERAALQIAGRICEAPDHGVGARRKEIRLTSDLRRHRTPLEIGGKIAAVVDRARPRDVHISAGPRGVILAADDEVRWANDLD